MLEVYLDPCTINSRKVLAGLELLQASYNYNFIDYFAGQQKSEEYKKINPCATVPCATDGDLTLTESNAILQYAADLGSPQGNPAYPQHLQQRADINRWLFWEASVWFQSCYIYLVQYVVKPLLKAEPDQAIIDDEEPNWLKLANILDTKLAISKYLTGNNVSIADIAVAAPMHLHAASRLPMSHVPNLARWIKDIEALPCWVNTQGAVDKALLLESPAEEDNGDGTYPTTSPRDSAKSTDDLPKGVRAIFNYTLPVPGPTELYFYDSPKASGIHEPGDDPHSMFVHDGWSRASSFSVDKEGFSLHNFTTSFDNWDDESATASQFYPEIVEFIKKTQGVKRVLVFDHTIRSKNNENKKLTEEQGTS